MKMINNLILDKQGFAPVTPEDLNSINGLSWHNWIVAENWTRKGSSYTTKEALKITILENTV